MRAKLPIPILVGSLLCAATPARADDAAAGEASSAEALAKKLSNPIASLVSVPFQFNYDHDIGPEDDGSRFSMIVQPVVPISLNASWNLISRTILPITWQGDVTPTSGDQLGTGDVVQSLWFSPKAPTKGGLIWGVGPALLLPTASDEMLGAEQWAAGPTLIGLKQSGRATYGALMNHLWSYAGDDDRAGVNATYLQPFFSYTTPSALTLGVSSESTYDWNGEDWAIPMVFNVSQLVKVGNRPISIGGGVRYWADPGENGAEGWSARFSVTLLFPK